MTQPGVIGFRDVPVPEMGPDQVLVRIVRIGVCGSDIHVNHGTHPFMSYPVVQGHEVSGVVEKAGPSVTNVKPGDPVTIMPQVTCGTCYACRHGNYHICDSLKVMGFQTVGTASDFFAVDAAKVLPYPSTMSYEEGAMIEPLAVAVHAVGRLGDVMGKGIAVYGAGPIGNLVAQTARGLGARRVLVTDVSEHRLAIAKQCGVDACINPSTSDLSAATVAAFGPDKADASLECVGIDATMDQAVSNARKGTDIVVVGVFGQKAHVDLGLVQDRELRLIGTLMYQEKDYRKAIELIATQKVQLKPLMSAHFPLERYADAYAFIDKNRDTSMKVFIDVSATK